MKKSFNSPIALDTKWKETKIIVGGTVKFTVEDARALYKLTTIPISGRNSEDGVTVDHDEWKQNNELCRVMLRNIAKTILITSGETTDIMSLVNSMANNADKD